MQRNEWKWNQNTYSKPQREQSHQPTRRRLLSLDLYKPRAESEGKKRGGITYTTGLVALGFRFVSVNFIRHRGNSASADAVTDLRC